jgi:hypothetical protein
MSRTNPVFPNFPYQGREEVQHRVEATIVQLTAPLRNIITLDYHRPLAANPLKTLTNKNDKSLILLETFFTLGVYLVATACYK